jgi:hypothetical protein
VQCLWQREMKVMCSEDDEAQAGGFSFNVEPSATQHDRQATTTWHDINSLTCILHLRAVHEGLCISPSFWALIRHVLTCASSNGK